MQLSFLLPIMVTAVGFFLLVKLRFFFILHPIKTAREFTSALKDREARRSFFLALAGTLGVGNIFGVSAGIMIGGAGSLFWLFISSLFSAIIKYAEILLAFDADKKEGGMAAVLSSVFHKKGGFLSYLFACLTVALSLFMGAAMQSAAVCDIAVESIDLMPHVTALILVFLLLPALLGDAKKIENITEIIIPLTTIIYIIISICVIIANFQKLPDTFFKVISSAASPSAITGGVATLAIKEGFARGILSNEAGTGTSAMAHQRAADRSPHIAGLFGMCEVFFDTTLLCTLTGLTILLSVPSISAYSTPMALVFAAFHSSLGKLGGLLLPLIFSFAYATLICWFYYGKEYSRLYLGRLDRFFPFAFILFTLTSYIIPSSLLLYFTDLILLFMTFLTLSAIVKKSSRIAELALKKPEL